MKRKRKDRSWWWPALIVIISAALLGGYYFGIEKGRAKPEIVLTSKPQGGHKAVTPQVKREIQAKNDSVLMRASGEINLAKQEKADEEETGLQAQEDYCSRIERDVRDFFSYLDKKKYIRGLKGDVDTYDHFKRLIVKVSAHPPVPAGEGIDMTFMTKNIYHFFRLLGRKDLGLIREIIRNEADTLELNLDMFYRWLTLGGRCPDRDGIRPSRDVLYKYAGFFLNTIGGRAYLFRRSTGLRLLVSYYCLLIIHDADVKGGNSDGIDIFPIILTVKDEIRFYPDFHFQKKYIKHLIKLKNYYQKKR